MRIDELIKPKELENFRDDYYSDLSYRREDSRNSIEKLLAPYGFKKLGSGFFSHVYENPKYPKEVFKVMYNDFAGKQWIKTSMENAGGNPYYPKIRSKPIKIVGDLFLVRLEKLEYKSDSEQEYFSLFLKETAKNLKIIVNRNKSEEEKRTYIFFSMASMIEDNAHYYDDPDFMEIMHTIVNLRHVRLDLHGGNFMWRGGQLVITDPVAKLD